MTEKCGFIDDIDITTEEIDRFTKAFKNDEFKKLFAEYCEEISDPANKRLYEQELTQLEAERGIEVTFINPEPGYVLKTTINGTDKAFINVAKCDKVGKPTSKCGQDADGHRGLNWSLPYTQSPPHRDIDKKGTLCVVYDVVFHSDTLHLAAKNDQFKKLVTDTACEAVRSAYNVLIDLINLKYPKIAFKGTARPTIIRKKSKNAPTEPIEPSPIDNIYPPLLVQEKPNVPSKKRSTNTRSAAQEAYTKPTYQLVHRKNVEYHELTNELDAKINAAIPNELVITIELPLIRSSDDVTLDVTSHKIFLISEKPAKYKLNVDLPYEVNELAGQAKFDKNKRRLVITLPVLRRREITITDLCHEDSGIELDRENSSSPKSNGHEADNEKSDEDTTYQKKCIVSKEMSKQVTASILPDVAQDQVSTFYPYNPIYMPLILLFDLGT